MEDGRNNLCDELYVRLSREGNRGERCISASYRAKSLKRTFDRLSSKDWSHHLLLLGDLLVFSEWPFLLLSCLFLCIAIDNMWSTNRLLWRHSAS